MTTLRDVAREAGVSVATASRAINCHSNVTAPTKAAVLAAVKKLNFVPHSGARSLTRRKTDTVGVILPDLFYEFFSQIIPGIDPVAHQTGRHLLLGNMHGRTHDTTYIAQGNPMFGDWTMGGAVKLPFHQGGAHYTWDGESAYGMIERSLPVEKMKPA